MLTIVALNTTADDFAVYSTTERNDIGTPLMFRGPLAECLAWRNSQR